MITSQKCDIRNTVPQLTIADDLFVKAIDHLTARKEALKKCVASAIKKINITIIAYAQCVHTMQTRDRARAVYL